MSFERPESDKREQTQKKSERVPYRNEQEYQGLLTKINARFRHSIQKNSRAALFAIGLGIMGGSYSFEIGYLEGHAEQTAVSQGDSKPKNAEIAAFEKAIVAAEENPAISHKEKGHFHALQQEISELKESLGLYFNLIDFEPKRVSSQEKSPDDIHYGHVENCAKLGIDFAFVKQMIAQIPPEMRTNITSIEFIDQIKLLDTQYGNKNAQQIIAANADWDAHAKTGTIHFFKLRDNKGEDKKWSKSEFEKILKHEATHLNDPSNAAWLSPTDRVQLAYTVMERVQDKDRAQYDEVENIKEEDPHRKLYEQMTEYLALTMETYATHPRQLSETDREIVEQYMSHTKWAQETY